MKPIFCIDITQDKENETSNSEEFLQKSISKEEAQRFADSFASVTDTVEKAKLPLIIRILAWVLGFYAFIVFGVVIKSLGETSFAEIYSKAKFFMLSGVVSGILWLVIFLMGRTKEKIVLEEEKVDEKLEKCRSAWMNCMRLWACQATLSLLTF